MIACQAKNETIVKYLCGLGAELDLQDEQGKTALMIACKLCSPGVVKLLLRYGAQVDIRDNEDQNAEDILDEADQKL